MTAERLAEVAHELRTPLGGIEAMAALLAQGVLSESQRHAVEALQASVAHLRQIAGEILDDHRAASTSAGVGVAPRTLDLAAFLAPIATAARLRAAARGVTFSLRISEGVPAVIGADGTLLRQMVENLLDNALKLTEAGSVSVSVDRVGRRGACHQLRFAVRDTGPGFDAGQAEQLFERFHRLDERRPGTGLGLALVRRLARGMGGDVGAEGMPGAGAIVWFTIAVEAAGAGNPAGSVAAIADWAPARPMPTILVVDDNMASRMVMTVVLKQFGCDAVQAASGLEALTLVETRSFAAVMMDMTMAGMDGADATRAIRRSKDGATLPVIGVTGRVGPSDEARFRTAGATGFLPKPISPRGVWACLREAGVFPADEPYPLAAA